VGEKGPRDRILIDKRLRGGGAREVGRQCTYLSSGLFKRVRREREKWTRRAQELDEMTHRKTGASGDGDGNVLTPASVHENARSGARFTLGSPPSSVGGHKKKCQKKGGGAGLIGLARVSGVGCKRDGTKTGGVRTRHLRHRAVAAYQKPPRDDTAEAQTGVDGPKSHLRIPTTKKSTSELPRGREGERSRNGMSGLGHLFAEIHNLYLHRWGGRSLRPDLADSRV